MVGAAIVAQSKGSSFNVDSLTRKSKEVADNKKASAAGGLGGFLDA
jgi:hypothetical protein